MRIDKLDSNYVEVTLSKRNCLALLAKLDGFPENSARELRSTAIMLNMDAQEEEVAFIVHIEPDEDHYAERLAGGMASDTEERMREMKWEESQGG